ncbi:MAG: DUF6599 family protein [Planctomycetota bacterium]|jgi:hypothetical protein
MGIAAGRAKRLESAISICLVAVLFLVALGIIIKQSNYNMSRYGIGTVIAERPLLALELETEQEQTFTLSSVAPAGFAPLSKMAVYSAENLYEKINGKAPLYTDSGFKELSTQQFISKTDESLWMELYIYDMGAVKNAFSVYSIQRRAEAEPLPPMRFAYGTSNAVYLVHGKYYIELVGSAESQELFRAMSEVCRKIRANLTIDHDSGIAELAFFPEDNLVEDSTKFYLANVFGSEGLTDTFSARYKFGDDTITAFLSKRASADEAQAVAARYHKFLIDNGGSVKPAANKAFEGKVIDFYDTTEIVFSTGPFVAGIHEAENQQPAEELAQILINKLAEAAQLR